MPGPFHLNCNCNCLPPFPCIEGCAKSGDFNYDEVTIGMSAAPTWSYSTGSDTFAYNNGTAVVNSYVPDVTDFGTSQSLWKRPDSSSFGYGQSSGTSVCQWLWNSPIAVPSKWLWPNFTHCVGEPSYPQVESLVADGTPYIPVNAVDSSSPWDRVLIANPDYDCGTCYCPGCGSIVGNPRGHYRCGNLIYFSSVLLYIAQSGVPAGSPPIYPTAGSGHWYWIVEFKAYGNFDWSYNSEFSVSPPTAEVHTAGSGAGAYPVDRIFPSSFGGHTIGGIAFDDRFETIGIIQYAKEIDCDTDFEGTSVTIPFNKLIDAGADAVYTFDSYPSSVTLDL